MTDQKIFRDFAAHWETAYFKDMDDLNVRRFTIFAGYWF